VGGGRDGRGWGGWVEEEGSDDDARRGDDQDARDGDEVETALVEGLGFGGVLEPGRLRGGDLGDDDLGVGEGRGFGGRFLYGRGRGVRWGGGGRRGRGGGRRFLCGGRRRGRFGGGGGSTREGASGRLLARWGVGAEERGVGEREVPGRALEGRVGDDRIALLAGERVVGDVEVELRGLGHGRAPSRRGVRK
jgi:hypothetical protein